MSIPYAPDGIAKDVVNGLRAVAVELKTVDQLHLPDFLDVDPRASHGEWVRQLAAKRTKIKNAPEGTADAQEKLGQTLAKHFKEKKSWRALLNRLGRMQIEASIGSLARRKPGAPIVRNALMTHVHTLESVVGAPDARAIVEELFRQHDLRVVEEPEPATEPESEPSLAVATRVAAPARRETGARRETEALHETGTTTATTDGGFWGRLGGAFLEALGEHLDRKVDEMRERADTTRRLAEQTSNISGQWSAPTGGVFTFSQRGLQVSVHGAASGVPVTGRGHILDRSIEIQGVSPAGGPFRASLVVSSDGQTMTGHLSDAYGRTSQVQLRRG